MKRNTQKAGFVIPGMWLPPAVVVIVAGILVVGSPAAGRRVTQAVVDFAEVEITLSDRTSLADISALPRAPGSDFEILANPKRVRVQVPAKQVKALVDKGADADVLRRFVLIDGSVAQGMGLEAAAMPEGTCSGIYSEGTNDTRVDIPDDRTWTYSDIPIHTAPAGAKVRCVDVHFKIIHDYVSELLVDLTNQDQSVEYRLWEYEGGIAWYILRTETGITAFNGQPVNQVWLLWAWDDVPFFDEGYIDSWWVKLYYADEPVRPANDHCVDAIAVTEQAAYDGTTVGATGSDQSSCSYNDTADVWHSYSPSYSGLVTISLAGSAFDTTLSVFDACGGRELVCDDDFCDSYQSEVSMNMYEGNTYLIRIAGYDGSTGDYILTVTNIPCALPDEPNSPSPANGMGDVSLNTDLSWNRRTLFMEAKQAAVSSAKDTKTAKVIYGVDDRKDEYQVTDPDILAAGDSTVALVDPFALFDNGDGTFSLLTVTFAERYEITDPIESGNPLCPDEPFRDQPSPAWASGFLVAPDIIATAGDAMCPDPDSCDDTAVVFGLVMLDAETPLLTIDESQVYYCRQVIARQTGDPSWALLRLDREVTGHIPLPVRSEGVIADDQDLIVIGHPFGIPRKYAAGARVRDNTAAGYFQANLDTYQGSSGAVVLNADTMVIEGLIYAGSDDFVQDGNCDRSNVCPDNTGCPDWEFVTRAAEFADLLGLEKYDVYFGRDNPPTELICTDADVPTCDPTPGPDATLTPCEKYFWKVVSKNSCGETHGPVWSFTTACEQCPCPGDLDTNNQVDLQDLDAMVNMLVAAGPPFIVPVEAGHCGDLAETMLQVDLQDLDALVNLLVAAGPPFIVPCE